MDDDEPEKKMRSAERASPLRYLEILTIGSFCAAFLSFGVATAMPADMTAERLLTICEAPTVQTAMIKDNLDKNDAIESTTAWWKRGAVEYSFVQVGSSAVINIGSSR